MKRNRFRLETVMRVRKIQENIEMGRLTQARLDVAIAEQRQAERIQAYTVATQPDGTAVSSHQFLRERGKFERLGEQVVTAAHDVAQARGEEHLRHHDWSIAAKRVSALDRLRDRHNEIYQGELSAEDVIDTDERTTQRRFHASRALNVTAADDSRNSNATTGSGNPARTRPNQVA